MTPLKFALKLFLSFMEILKADHREREAHSYLIFLQVIDYFCFIIPAPMGFLNVDINLSP